MVVPPRTTEQLVTGISTVIPRVAGDVLTHAHTVTTLEFVRGAARQSLLAGTRLIGLITMVPAVEDLVTRVVLGYALERVLALKLCRFIACLVF